MGRLCYFVFMRPNQAIHACYGGDELNRVRLITPAPTQFHLCQTENSLMIETLLNLKITRWENWAFYPHPWNSRSKEITPDDEVGFALPDVYHQWRIWEESPHTRVNLGNLTAQMKRRSEPHRKLQYHIATDKKLCISQKGVILQWAKNSRSGQLYALRSGYIGRYVSDENLIVHVPPPNPLQWRLINNSVNTKDF